GSRGLLSPAERARLRAVEDEDRREQEQGGDDGRLPGDLEERPHRRTGSAPASASRAIQRPTRSSTRATAASTARATGGDSGGGMAPGPAAGGCHAGSQPITKSRPGSAPT